VTGNRSLVFTGTSLTQATSNTINVTAGAASKLTITTAPPANATSGDALTTQPAIQLRDASDNPVATPGVTVNAVFDLTPGGTPTLVNASAITDGTGLATFAGLAISGPVGDYTLRFESAGLASVTSGTITLAAGSAAKLAITTPPSATVQNDEAFPQQPVLQVQDAAGNNVNTAVPLTVTAAITAPGTGVLTNASANTNASGQATFAGLTITGLIGDRTLDFTEPSLTSVTSGTVTVEAGSATQIVIVTQPPASIASGATLVPNPVVDLADVSGNDVDSAGVDIAVALGGGGTLGGTTPRTTGADGRATFNDLTITGSAGDRTLDFTNASLATATSNTINVTAGGASQLVIITQPSTTARSSLALATVPVVQVRDASNNPVSGVTVDAALNGGGGLSGTTSAASDGSGNVTFTGLAITGLVGTKSLTFSSGVLPTVQSDDITLSAGPATQLGISTQPSSTVTNGVDFPQQPVIQLLDSEGNALDSAGASITPVLSQGTGSLNDAAAVLTVANGSATFAGLDITGTAPGPFAIRFDAAGLTSVTSNDITLQAGAAASLVITTQPSAAATNDVVLAQQPVVQVRDANNNPVSGVDVTLDAAATGGGTVSADNPTVTTDVNGNATFSGVKIVGLAGTKNLVFHSAGLADATSDGIALGVGAAAQLVITTQPGTTAPAANTDLNPQGVVEIQDSGGNLLTAATDVITASLVTVSGGPGSLIGTLTKAATGGVADFAGNGMQIDAAGSYRIRYTLGAITVDSDIIVIP
jgi:adhesin/invasin